MFTNEVLVFDKNVDGLVHYLEILSDDISITVDKSWLWLEGEVLIFLHTPKQMEFRYKT